MNRLFRRTNACLAALYLTTVLTTVLTTAPVAWAQGARGNVYGTVVDESGASLPGATVTLESELGRRDAVADGQGQFRFLGVDHGRYKLSATLNGFSIVARELSLSVGQNLTLDLKLKLATIQEEVTITAETPLVDTKKMGTGTAITGDELRGIPQARDPWSVMRTVPGIVVDQVNIAGSESGQQSSFYGKGADSKDHVWKLDGIEITDEVSMSSPTYFNFENFDEINLTTGAGDVTQSTGGIGIDLVTKRGTNTFHGALGGYFAHDKLQSSNLPEALAGDPRLRGSDKADHAEQLADYGLDLGGPIVKDRLWFYGSYNRNDIRIKRLSQSRDKTLLANYNAKLNWQMSSRDMISAFWFNGEKAKLGRATGAAAQEAPTHLWTQGGEYTEGRPKGLSKLEWNRVFSPSLFGNLKLAYYNNGFSLRPTGGLDQREIIDNQLGEARGSSLARLFLRPQYTGNLDFTRFAQGTGGSHEIKVGLGYRRVESTNTLVAPGDRIQVRFEANGLNRARFYREGTPRARGESRHVFLSDSFRRGRLTATLALRLDRQTARNLPSTARAHPAIPELLPDAAFAGSDDLYTWTSLAPRAGLTFALDEDRKTLLRGSFSRYAGLASFAVDGSLVNPVNTATMTFPWNDRNSDRDVQIGEVDFTCRTSACGFSSSGVDVSNPSATSSSPYSIPSGYGPNKDTEVVLGIERELAPNLAASASYTWRRSTSLTATQLWSGSYWYNWTSASGRPFTAVDYRAQSPVTANGYTATSYLPTAAAEAEFAGNATFGNRSDIHRVFNGLELTLVKRLSSRWMGRAAFALNDWREHLGPGAVNNPTRHDWDPLDDGAQVVTRETGSGKIYYVNARWQFVANGLAQLGKGFDLSFALLARQGYPNPVYLSLPSGFDGNLRVLPDGFRMTDRRFETLWNVDFRLAKATKVSGLNLLLSAELFNAFNNNATLRQLGQANSSQFGRIDEIMAPRILRLGARVTF